MQHDTIPADRKNTRRDQVRESYSRIQRAVERGVALYVRVSTDRQARDSKGSIDYQHEQAKFLEAFGVQPEAIMVYEELGASAKRGSRREVFVQLIEDIEAGRIGLVCVAFADRALRALDDVAERLYQALARVGGMLLIGGNYYNPADANQLMILKILAVIAEHDNQQRALRSLTGRLAKARKLGAVVPLPTGLTWASPEDPAYIAEMQSAELGSLITADALATTHRACAERNGRPYYILPDPRDKAYHAAQLAVSWLMETRDLRAVLERIHSDSRWPRPGEFPVCRSSVFDNKSPIEWKRLRDRPDGKDDLEYGVVYQWITNRALYGIYRFESPALDGLSAEAGSLGNAVCEYGAFPAVCASATYAEVRSILANPLGRFRTVWKGPRLHAIPHLVCDHPLPNGEICGRNWNAVYTTSQPVYYKGDGCAARNHAGSCSRMLDDVVIAAVKEAFAADRLRGELDIIRATDHREDTELKRLRADVKALRDRVAFVADQIERLGIATHPESQGGIQTATREIWEQRLREYLRRLNQQEPRLRHLETQVDKRARLAVEEEDRVLRLANDVPELLDASRGVHELTRRLLAHLIRQVRIRRLGRGTFRVRIVFPSGEEVTQLFYSNTVPAPQPMRAYLYSQLARWCGITSRDQWHDEQEALQSAAEIASTINKLVKQKRGVPKLDAESALALAIWYAYRDIASHDVNGQSIAQIASRTASDRDEVLARVLEGALGDAWVSADGEILVQPTEAQLQRALPRYSRRCVADAAGLPNQDIVPLTELAADRVAYASLRVRAKARGALFWDENGTAYTARSAFPDQAVLVERLRGALPQGIDPSAGEWLTAQAVLRLIPTTAYLLKRHAVSCAPGMGENGLRTRYYWIDAAVRQNLQEAAR